MRKIVLQTDGIGTIEWTLPAGLEAKINSARPEVQPILEESLRHLADGFFLALSLRAMKGEIAPIHEQVGEMVVTAMLE